MVVIDIGWVPLMALASLVLMAVVHLLRNRFFSSGKDKHSKSRRSAHETAGMTVQSVIAGNSQENEMAHFCQYLTPRSTHLQILYLVATSPGTIHSATEALDRLQVMKQERMELEAEEEKKNKRKKTSKSDLLAFELDDDGGWAEDDEDGDSGLTEEQKTAAKKAKEAEEEKAKAAKQLAAATGKTKIKMEELDEGVLGQKWVESTLEKGGHWPPPKEMFATNPSTYEYKGQKNLTALEHPAIRRSICMTMGRLHAPELNTHAELVEASKNGMIDGTYFKTTMDYRQRVMALLELALRVAMAMRCHKLAATVIETQAMFRIGVADTSEKSIQWFRDAMTKQYGTDKGVPMLEIESPRIILAPRPPANNSNNNNNPAASNKNDATTTTTTTSTDTAAAGASSSDAVPALEAERKEIATGDLCAVEMKVTRKHAETFTRHKLLMCQKQGIPPQVALGAFQEQWWIIVRAQPIHVLGDGGKYDLVEIPETPISKLVMKHSEKHYEEFDHQYSLPGERLVTAWPFVISNVAQVAGKVKVGFKAPSVAGKYQFHISILSGEFLGSNHELSVNSHIVNKEEEEKGGDDNDDETKKEK